MRLRVHFGEFGTFYIGNEGFTRQFEVYGSDISNVQQVGDDSYVLGQWYTLRIEVGDDGKVALYKDNVLTHIAERTLARDVYVTMVPGDGWSAGHAQFSDIKIMPMPFASYGGTIAFQGLANSALPPTTVDLVAHYSDGDVVTVQAPVNDNTFSARLPLNPDRISAKPTHWLRHTLYIEPTNGDDKDLFFNLVNGDCYSDNVVDIRDLNLVLVQFGLFGTADLNEDGIVDLFDLNQTLINFGRLGDVP